MAKPKIDATKRMLARMLKESTGTHFLDSGGDAGRHWQRNQVRDFETEPQSVLSFSYSEISVTHNVYHWLASKLTYNPSLDRSFQRFAKGRDEYDLETMGAWVEEYLPKKYGEVTGIYGDGKPVTVNTYNGEDLVSQTLQYTYFELADGARDGHVVLQIHGGADVRGGYTRPRVFDVNEELGIFDNARASIACDTATALADQKTLDMFCTRSGDLDSHAWDSDDGHNWYANDGGSRERKLKDYPILFADEIDGFGKGGEPVGAKYYDEDGKVITGWRPGIIWVETDGRGRCPKCGGFLSSWFY